MAKKKPEWNELPCPVCREPVDVDAARCPHCTTIYTPELMAARRGEFDTKLKFTGIGMLVLVVLLLGFCAFSGSSDESERDDAAAIEAPSEPVMKPEGSATPEETRALTFAWREILAHGERCDAANRPVQAALDQSDIYRAFSAAREAQEVCEGSALDIANVTTPDLIIGDARDKFAETKSRCRVAYINKAEALAVLQRALDGEMRPSVIEEYRREAQAAGEGVISCVASGMLVARMMGVTMEEMSRSAGDEPKAR